MEFIKIKPLYRKLTNLDYVILSSLHYVILPNTLVKKQKGNILKTFTSDGTIRRQVVRMKCAGTDKWCTAR